MAEYGQLQISAKGLAQIWHFSDKAHTPAHNLTQTAGGLSTVACKSQPFSPLKYKKLYPLFFIIVNLQLTSSFTIDNLFSMAYFYHENIRRSTVHFTA